MTAPETRHEETLRSALMCSRKSFVCVHGDHEIDAADITALLTVIAALRAEVATLREAVRNLPARSSCAGSLPPLATSPYWVSASSTPPEAPAMASERKVWADDLMARFRQKWWHFGRCPRCWVRYSEWFWSPSVGHYCFLCFENALHAQDVFDLDPTRGPTDE